jgi:hypothetical protein
MLLSADDDTSAAIILSTQAWIIYVTSVCKPKEYKTEVASKELLCISLEITSSNLLGVTVGIVLEDHYRSIVTLQLYLRRVTTKA